MDFPVATGNGTRSKGLKLQQRKCRVMIRGNFLPMMMVNHWNTLPREVVDGQPLE